MRGRILGLGLGAAAACLSLVGCSRSAITPPKDLGREEIIERTPDNRPDWLETSFEEEDGSLYLKGQVTGVPDQALGMRQAKAAAVQNLVESIRMKARSEFSEAVRGVNASKGAVGRYLDTTVAWTTDNVNVSGAVPAEEYSEKVRVRTYDGFAYRYNCYVRLRLPMEEYLHARQEAIDRASAEAPDDEARDLAREAKRKLEDRP